MFTNGFSNDGIGLEQLNENVGHLLNPMSSYIIGSSYNTGSFQQIDLNDSKNLIDLEDPSLIEHMANARQRLLEAEKQNKTTKNEINLKMIDASRQITFINKQIKNVHSTLSLSLENLLLQTSNMEKITNNETPHGFPKIRKNTQLQGKDWEDNFNHLSKKISPIGETITENIEIIIGLEKNLVLLGRTYQLLIGELFDFNEKIIDENASLIKEFLPEEDIIVDESIIVDEKN